MPVRRVFLGWDRPLLSEAASWLLEQASTPLNFGDVLCVTPGGRAGRRLLALLTEASGVGGAIVPPRVITPAGLLAELLPPAPGPIAGPLEQAAAWGRAIRALHHDDLHTLIAAPPEPDDDTAWFELGEMLAQTSEALASEGLRIADAAEVADRIAPQRDRDRWRALRLADADRRRLLHDAGRRDELDHALAVLFGDQLAMPGGVRVVVLVGILELPGLVARALRALPGEVVALAGLPPEHEGLLGDLALAAGQNGPALPTPPIQPGRLLVGDTPGDQALAALHALESLSGTLASDRVVIGVPDSQVAGALERRAREAGLLARSAAGTPIERTAPARLLAACAEHLRTRTHHAWGSLLRHADFERALARHLGSPLPAASEAWLATLDRYLEDRVQSRASVEEFNPRDPDERALAHVLRATHEMLGPLASTSRQPASAWSDAILALLARIYAGRVLRANVPEEQTILASCQQLHAAAVELSRLGTLSPRATSSEAIDMLLARVRGRAVPDEPDPEAVEMLGWLELALDDADAAIVTGFNDGVVPARLAADPLLPGPLRRALGLPTEDSRAARDAVLLNQIVRSRPNAWLIAGRRSLTGDPLRPSRLFFACPDDEVPSRVRLWVGEERERPPASPRERESSGFFSRPVLPAEQPSFLRVTAFRDYLRAPYLFYLRHVLRLRELAPDAPAMDAPAFGDVLHDALRVLPTLDPATLRSKARLARALDDRLRALARERFGKSPSPALQLQVEQASARLERAAEWQAQRAREGWTILHAEWDPRAPENASADPPALLVDGVAMPLHGRIDRIDAHETRGLELLDFKTGDRVRPPDATHRTGGEWHDLQLPLYRHLAHAVTRDNPVALGLVWIAGTDRPVERLLAAWKEDDLASADQTAERVVRRVRQGEFAELGNPAAYAGAFAALAGVAHIAPHEGAAESHAELPDSGEDEGDDA
jgi:RecB family exonuclease